MQCRILPRTKVGALDIICTMVMRGAVSMFAVLGTLGGHATLTLQSIQSLGIACSTSRTRAGHKLATSSTCQPTGPTHTLTGGPPVLELKVLAIPLPVRALLALHLPRKLLFVLVQREKTGTPHIRQLLALLLPPCASQPHKYMQHTAQQCCVPINTVASHMQQPRHTCSRRMQHTQRTLRSARCISSTRCLSSPARESASNSAARSGRRLESEGSGLMPLHSCRRGTN